MITNTLINEKWLKEFSPIPLNYNMKELHNYIKLAETIWVLPLLGDDWYDELLDQVAKNELSDANSTALVEAIYPLLGFAVAYEALPIMWAHISEVGITLGKSDQSDSCSLKDMTYIQNHMRAQVEVRKDFCKKWICSHWTSFPYFDPCAAGCDPACGCDCGCGDGKLQKPNRYQQLYSTCRKRTNLK